MPHPLEQKRRNLSLHTPAVARERSTASKHPVTRDQDSDLVRGNRRRDSTRRTRPPDPLCEGLVVARGPGRDFQESAPDLDLEVAPLDQEMERPGRNFLTEDPPRELLRLVCSLTQGRLRERRRNASPAAIIALPGTRPLHHFHLEARVTNTTIRPRK